MSYLPSSTHYSQPYSFMSTSLPRQQCTAQNTSSAFSANAQPNEDWTQISDLAERRRIQNRIAQRNYRKKLKRRLEDLERRAGSTSASPEPQPRPSPPEPLRSSARSEGRQSSAQRSSTGSSTRLALPPSPDPFNLSHPPAQDDRHSSYPREDFFHSAAPSPSPELASYASFSAAEHTRYSPSFQSGSYYPEPASSYHGYLTPRSSATPQRSPPQIKQELYGDALGVWSYPPSSAASVGSIEMPQPQHYHQPQQTSASPHMWPEHNTPPPPSLTYSARNSPVPCSESLATPPLSMSEPLSAATAKSAGGYPFDELVDATPALWNFGAHMPPTPQCEEQSWRALDDAPPCWD